MSEAVLSSLVAELAEHLGCRSSAIEALLDHQPLQVVIQADGFDVQTRVEVARLLKRHNDLLPVTSRVVLSSLTTASAPAEH